MIISLWVARRGMESQIHYAVFSLHFKGGKKKRTDIPNVRNQNLAVHLGRL